MQLWCNALNEFLLDTEGRLTLACILSKGASLYSSKDRTEMMDFSDTSDQECDEREDQEDENEEEEDGHLEDMLDQDLNWELEV